ncbi:hypothetical protein [Schleiferilactobacillus shenzhenensis]|nr:hypothetical protein [Schleiferilactobacillus shenzhenensis]
MAEETDFLLRQIKGIAGSMGYILGKKEEGMEAAVIFPADKPPLPYQDVLRGLLHDHQYQEALTKFDQIRYAMEQDDYVKLGLWLYTALLQLPEKDRNAAKLTLPVLQAGLNQLTGMAGAS